MTDYGMPEADTEALDRAWTEETMNRAHDLANELFEATADPRNGITRLHVKTTELCELIYKLGTHLDQTAGYNITGGTA